MGKDAYRGAKESPVQNRTIQAVTYPPPGDDEYPIRRDLGTVRSYTPGHPSEVHRLATGLAQLVDHLRHDAARIRASLHSAAATGWRGQHARQFDDVVNRLPTLMTTQLIPTLDEAVARLRHYAQQLQALQDETQRELTRGQNSENRRYNAKRNKDHEVQVTNAVSGHAHNLKNEMQNNQSQVVRAMNELEDLRSQKKQADLSLAQHLDDAAVHTNGIANAVVDAVPGATAAPYVAPVVGGAAAPIVEKLGKSLPTTPKVGETIGRVRAAADAGETGSTDAPVVSNPVMKTVAVEEDASVLPSRQDGSFPVDGEVDTSASEINDGGLSPTKLVAMGAVGALAVGGSALLSRRMLRSEPQPPSPVEEVHDAEPPAPAPEAAKAVVLDSAEPVVATEDASVDLALPVAIAAASAFVGLLVAAVGGGFGGAVPARAAEAIGDTWSGAARRVLGRRVVDQLTENAPFLAAERADGEAAATAVVALPGGLVADVPGGWRVARDEHCVVLTPSKVGTFAPNIVVLFNSSASRDALAGVDELPGHVVLQDDMVARLNAARARFGYAAGETALTVHRLSIPVDSGVVVVSSAVATAATVEDAPALDAVLHSIRHDG